MSNPTIEALQNEKEFELIAKLTHPEIKEFVLNQLSKGGRLVKAFMVYQIIMIVLGLFFVSRSIVFALNGIINPLYFTMGALVFCFSLLIIIHELLHGIAIKLTGAKKVNYGAYFRKFVFYAEADRYVMNRNQFAFVALTPLVVVKIVTFCACIFLLNNPVFYFFIIVMCAHSLFCAGDIGLLSIFYADKESEIFTYDVKAEKTSYYYRRVKMLK